MTQHNDRLYLQQMLESAEKAQEFLADITKEEYAEDEVLRLAVAHLVQIIGEAARSVSPEFQASHPKLPWKPIMGMRHRIVHQYAELDDDIVWQTVMEDLPPLITTLKQFLNEME